MFSIPSSHPVRLWFDSPDIPFIRALTFFMSTRTGTVDHDAEVGATPGHMGGPRARHQGLGRDTADVDAGPADQLALDHGGLQSFGVQPPGKGRTRLTGPDDDRVECPPPWKPFRGAQSPRTLAPGRTVQVRWPPCTRLGEVNR